MLEVNSVWREVLNAVIEELIGEEAVRESLD